MKSTSGALPTDDLRLAFVAIVALTLAAGPIAARTFTPTIPIWRTPGNVDIAPRRPAAPAAPLLTAPPAATTPTAVPQSPPAGGNTPPSRPDTKPAGPGVIGKDPLRADDDPATPQNLPGKGALKQ